ncbi:peptidylprolyl isomerase [Pseudoflavonifractor phocaeensis]|uniref:peptidylprolyl isomerase n=1 Tax=Pseudoflavonifractor phocaeensis TaxID=1870988 RepID=UPI00195940F0|nr:peptidylprolyl isomerase [Pseudoflavonifractor phocaeensis]MBM6870441.1 peptidylprolyl isomerase [Pseudoflavonifractor phocaeensis]
MNMTKKLLSGVVSAALLAGVLSGCSSQPAEDDVAYKAAGIARDTVVATVNGQKIPAEDYLFWLQQSITNIQYYGYLTSDDWTTEQLGDQNGVDYVKSDALTAVTYYATIAQKAEENGISLSEEDKTAVQENMDDIEAALAAQNITLQMYLDAQCISQEGMVKMNELYYLSQDLIQAFQEGGPLDPGSDAVTAFADENGLYRVKHILLSTRDAEGNDLSEAEQQAILEEANALVAELRAADDLETAFDAAMNERSDDSRNDDGTLAYPEYVTSSGQMVEEFETAALALQPGQMSEPVKSPYGYHIILRLSSDCEDVRSYYASNQLNDWTDAAEVETNEVYDTIDPQTFKANMDAIIAAHQETIDAANAAASAAPTGDETTGDGDAAASPSPSPAA